MEQKPYRLMAPGPVPMPDTVRQALSEPMIHHRTPEFSKIFSLVREQLKSVFQTSQPVMIHTSTGSGGMESAIVNTLSPGDQVLAIVSGKFGQRWADIAEAYGMQVQRLNVEWGEAAKVSEVIAALESEPQTKVVLCQACETSTATLHPIQQLATAIKDHSSALFMVDAITAIAATELPMDEWHLDVVVAGSQKSFMLPTGLAFIALSKRAWQAYERSTCPKYYWDLGKEKKANDKNQTFFSSPVASIRALGQALNQMSGPFLVQQIERSQKLMTSTHEAMKVLGLEIFSTQPSSAVTAIKVPEGIDGEKWRSWMEVKHNLTLMGGQDHLKGKIVRIGHMGHITDDDQLQAIEIMATSLVELGYTAIDKDQISEAVNIAGKWLRGN